MPNKSKSLPLVEIERRLKNLGYELADGQDGLLVFWQIRPPYFPHAKPRRIAYHFPAFYREWDVVPASLVDDILLHLFLNYEEDEHFWEDEQVAN